MWVPFRRNIIYTQKATTRDCPYRNHCLPESIALSEITGFKPAFEPLYTLFGGTVGKGIRAYAAYRFTLQCIIAYEGGCPQRFVNITGFKQQFYSDLKRIGFFAVPASMLLGPLHFFQCPLNILHIVAYLMHKHIGLCKISRSVMSLCQLIKKT